MAVLSADIPRPAFRDACAVGMLDSDALDAAAAEIGRWPEYRPSPLVSLPGLARRLGLGELWVKDEGRRFGLGGVKALGAPYGLVRLLQARGARPGSAAAARLTAIAATDGNHGLALAWAAGRFGCRARVYVGHHADADRLRAIRACGGEVIVVTGTYDDAVIVAEAAAAADPDLLLVTDTDYGAGHQVTRDIMAGYAVLGREVHAQMPGAPSHLVLQCGVGGMAAGVAAGLWHASGEPPSVITVEPEAAACLRDSLMDGRPAHAAGDLRTRMAGLSCGRPSLPALAILRDVVRASLTVSDVMAAEVQARLAAGGDGDPPLAGGDTGVAGLAGVWAAATSPDLRQRLDLGRDSRVITVLSEGPPGPPEA